jgi:hypothetical protein
VQTDENTSLQNEVFILGNVKFDIAIMDTGEAHPTCQREEELPPLKQ